MQRIKLIKIVLVIFAALTTLPVALAQAQEQKIIDEADFIRNVNLTVYDSISTERVIQSFDVNDQGWFAICYRTNEIFVYDETGTFQYRYHFNCQGDYGISLLSENLVIYFVRGDIAAVFDLNGQLISTQNMMFSNQFLNEEIYRTTKKIENTTYSLERDIGIFRGDYSRLVAINEYGDRVVLYDATQMGYFSGMLHYLILISIPLLLIVTIVSVFKKEEREQEHSTD